MGGGKETRTSENLERKNGNGLEQSCDGKSDPGGKVIGHRTGAGRTWSRGGEEGSRNGDTETSTIITIDMLLRQLKPPIASYHNHRLVSLPSSLLLR